MQTASLLITISLAILVLSIGITPIVQGIPADNASDTAKEITGLVVPDTAKEIAPGVFSLGTTVYQGTLVEGLLIFHHKDGHTRGPGGGGTDDDNGKCFAFLTDRKVKWKTVEPWIINPSNTEGLAPNEIASKLSNNIIQWENSAGKNILGEGVVTSDTLIADLSSPDGNNEVYFGDIRSPGAIAVAIVWYQVIGPPIIVEWDMVFDQADFDWTFNPSKAGEADKMDFDNIAAHEIGHVTGMGHPTDDCTEETMYRFAGAGETKKRDLNTRDITGIQRLY